MLWVILTTFSIACSLREFKNPLLMDFWTKYNQTYLKRAADWRFLSVWSVSLWRSLLPVLCELRNEFSPITNYWIHKRGESRSHLHNVALDQLSSENLQNYNDSQMQQFQFWKVSVSDFIITETRAGIKHFWLNLFHIFGSVCSFSVFLKALNL